MEEHREPGLARQHSPQPLNTGEPSMSGNNELNQLQQQRQDLIEERSVWRQTYPAWKTPLSKLPLAGTWATW